MSKAITNHLGLYLDQVEVRKSSAQPSDCTKKGISTLFVEIARKAQEGGIFIFYFAGHGILVRERCVLAPADFAGRENLDSGISGKDLVEWLHEAECKADHVLIILDCCYAGDLGTVLTAPEIMLRIKSNLFVMCGCAAKEKCLSFEALGHSIFNYFFLRYLEKHPCKEQFLIKEAMEYILSFSSLIVRHEEKHLLVCKMHPILKTAVSKDEIDSSKFEAVIQLLEGNRSEPLEPVPHSKVEKWLRSPTIQDALRTLNAWMPFSDHKELLEGIFCALLYSAASIQCANDKTHLEERNLFLTMAISILGTISFAYPNVDVTIFQLRKGLLHYWAAAIIGELSEDSSLRNLDREMVTKINKLNTVTANNAVAKNSCDGVDSAPIQFTTEVSICIVYFAWADPRVQLFYICDQIWENVHSSHIRFCTFKGS